MHTLALIAKVRQWLYHLSQLWRFRVSTVTLKTAEHPGYKHHIVTWKLLCLRPQSPDHSSKEALLCPPCRNFISGAAGPEQSKSLRIFPTQAMMLICFAC